MLVSAQYFNPQSGGLVKEIRFTGGWPARVDLDRNGDGTFETYDYDFYGELIEHSGNGANQPPATAPTLR